MRLQITAKQNIVPFLLLAICIVFLITNKNTVYASDNTSFHSAMPVSVNQFYTNSNPEGPLYYAFTLDKDGSISISFTHDYDDADRSFDLTIYNSDYNEVQYTWVDGQTECNITTIRNGLPAGQYYLKVGGYCKKVYNFQINYTESDDWETELNNEFQYADDININQRIYGSGVSGDDYFKFHMPEAALIKVHFIHDYEKNNNWTLTLYDNYYKKIQETGWISGTDCNINSEAIYVPAGTYYLKIESQHQFEGKYGKEYNFEIVTHTHSFTEQITKATTSMSGTIIEQCSCGAIQNITMIAYPKTISLSATSYTYDGTEKKPSVVVKDSDGKNIDPSNYVVSYASGRKNVGTYKVTLRFKGNYSGVTSRAFKIHPKPTSLSKLTSGSKKFTVKWKKQTEQITGYQIQYSSSRKFSPSTRKMISKSSITSTTCNGLKAKKNYYVRIRTYKKVSGTNYYSSWSPAKMVTTKK